ncbi:MAG: hypothetical protein JNG82_07315 [Opitutaceae bacterium]|nr:hypothetical protein [Opitutaceae bacterium]
MYNFLQNDARHAPPPAGFADARWPNEQLDLGCNFGVTHSAPDYQPFIGFSRRF